ncbi:hypothetical protein A2531_06370 [Candidatus Falkowbacteria bacterium RIFOXYD2_FULL_34_120]|uniref:NAD-dependent epimerase/dehydratase domain-containing protein n=1 Tax=Candidatus Falkowbacteria bacterium RIFOXYD2_FULL_34_120 TaxID=1798007 RepID=A0A1F5TRL3_9BACT|nr:MAG: hypothetical protein A2515_00135 [Candidatus Falkowbacteria bacterium RIFOXYD12_FULL_34_57]OGF41636.1 MAG: hypothetical protein A2531_06370 [Candidatus Falkowbacteria bacterium RIFOXYD2_FULL_34_120]
MKKNRIIITGGKGFIGSHLIKNLTAKNYKNLLSIDKHKSKNQSTKTVVGDFFDTKILNNTLQKDDTVIHMACSSVPALSETDKEKDIQENLIGSIKLFQACVEKQVKKVIYFSSGGTVYGNYGKRAIKETDAQNPFNAHGAMKLAVEKYLQVFSHVHGLNYIILRPGNPYGRTIDNHKNQGIIDIFLKKITNNEPLEIWGDGKIVRDYIHINDLTGLIIKIIENEVNNEIFNAGTGIGTSINELIKIIKKTTGKNITVNYRGTRNFDVKYNILNIEKAKKLLNWQPRINIEQGVKMHVATLKISNKK